jgi:uncharacterized protein (UPF0332 family)
LTGEGRTEACAEELTRADEELAAADTLMTARLFRVAVTRAYFAAFHAARALLYANGHEPRTHEGVHHLLQIHFVKTARLEIEQGRALARLQTYRGEADYGDAVVDERAARGDVDTARAFCRRIRELLGPHPI